ncbi:unnamed protein product [Mytilus coruscus]|uniref:Uncharacterized protein n=1 Tax=Mytilus coruscus TaxID=42192 RepID=A0A6J8D5Z6_MYTCO|nr:unnamed protein product [Mytilus coruscus]
MGASELLLNLRNWEFVHSAIVADLGNISGILGLDFLSKNEVTINASKGTLSFPNFTVKLLLIRTFRLHVHVYSLPTRYTFRAGPKCLYAGNLGGILEPVNGFQRENHALIPKSVFKTSDTEVVFSVLNPTPNTVILRKNLTVASLQPIEDIMEKNFHRPTSSINEACIIPEHLKSLTDNVFDDLSYEQKSDLEKVISAYSDIFVGPDGKLGRTNLVEHSIITETDRPVKVPPGRLPISQREVAAAEIDKMLKNDIIEPSYSAYAAPIVFVRKSESTTRF